MSLNRAHTHLPGLALEWPSSPRGRGKGQGQARRAHCLGVDERASPPPGVCAKPSEWDGEESERGPVQGKREWYLDSLMVILDFPPSQQVDEEQRGCGLGATGDLELL